MAADTNSDRAHPQDGVLENRLVVAKGAGAGGGMEREVRVNTCEPLHTGWTNGEALLCSTESHVQCTVSTVTEKSRKVTATLLHTKS